MLLDFVEEILIEKWQWFKDWATEPTSSLLGTILLAVVNVFPLPDPLKDKEPKPVGEIRTKLGRLVDFRDFDHATVEEALEFLNRRYGLKCTVEEEALKMEGDKEILKAEFPRSDPNVFFHNIPRSGVPLYQVLQVFLRRIPTQSDVTFVVRETGVHITTANALAARKIRPEPPPLTRDILAAALRIPMRLAQRLNFAGIDDDPRLTFSDVIEYVSRRYGLHFDLNERPFRREGLDILGLKILAKEPIPKMDDILVARLLLRIMERAPAQYGLILRLQVGGVIEFTTKKAIALENRSEE